MSPETERRFRLTVQYEGTYFLGWQRQARGRTVQGEMEYALQRLTGSRRTIVAAGRTDSGVHATGQSVALDVPARWDAEELRRALNATLPHDIWVESALRVPADFHPRYAALARSYRYQLGLTEEAFSPFLRPWCWPVIRPPEPELLHAGAGLLVGDHSFRAFAKVGQESRGDRCHVTQACWVPWDGGGLALEITANRFLHHMVRYLVGTLVEIGRHQRPMSHLSELLEGNQTPLTTSPPAPPEGLFLTKVHYPKLDSELD